MTVEILGVKLLGIHVCAPKDMAHDDVIAAVEREHPCGTTHGWQVSERPTAAPVQCDEKPDHVHLVLDA